MTFHMKAINRVYKRAGDGERQWAGRTSMRKWHWGCDLKDANKPLMSRTFELEGTVNGGNERRPFCVGLELGEQEQLWRPWPALVGSFWPSQGIEIFFLRGKVIEKI